MASPCVTLVRPGSPNLGTPTQLSKSIPCYSAAEVLTRTAGVESPVTKAEIVLTLRSGGHQMESLQDRLIILLRAYRTIRFCDACLAMKLGAFPRDVREAVILIGEGFQISSGQCSECLREKTVVCAVAA